MSRRAKTITFGVLCPALVVTALAMLWLWPVGGKPATNRSGPQPQQLPGVVTTVNPKPCPTTSPPPASPPAAPKVCGTVGVRVGSGPDAGKQITVDIPSGPGAPVVKAGDHVVLIYAADSPPEQRYQLIDHDRGSALWAVVAAFVLAVLAFGRWRGLTALVGLAVTFGVLLLFVVPAILDGRSPLLVAIVGSAAIMFVVLYLTHGLSVPTSMAVLGTLASLTLTGVLAAFATAVVKLTGIASSDDSFLAVTFANVNMQGLLLAGILIGSLGVLDDVAVTQSFTVTELARANPTLPFGQLYRRAGRVGRAHIASVVNTIVLAYAGASLPVLILFAAGNQPLGQVLTTQLLAQEIVRSAVGTIGLIAAVPITTALAALAARSDQGYQGRRQQARHRDSSSVWAREGR
jgi:uncharacterized membrane protein